MNWYSVGDRLPNEGDEVMTWFIDHAGVGRPHHVTSWHGKLSRCTHWAPITPPGTYAAPGEAELGRELIAWAASPDRIIHEDYSYWCEICYGGVTSGPDVDHADDCLHLRARALRDSE